MRSPDPVGLEPAASATAVLTDVATVLFDLDGCIWFGNELAPGAADLVADLRTVGLQVGFLTNISHGRARDVAGKLRRLGIPADEADVLMPIEALAEHPRLAGRPPTWVLGQAEVHAAVAALTPISSRPEEAELLVLSRDPALRYQDLSDALQVLVGGGALLALNIDLLVPVEGGRVLPGNGAIAAALSAASGVPAEVVGKPSAFFFQTAMRRFGAVAARTLMVGDTLDSDIAGGAAAGMRTVQVGSSAASRLDPAPVPDHRIAAVADLRDLLLP